MSDTIFAHAAVLLIDALGKCVRRLTDALAKLRHGAATQHAGQSSLSLSAWPPEPARMPKA